MNLHQLINEFLEYLEIERNVSPLTIRNYGHYLNRFLDFLAGTPLADDKNATEDQLKQIEEKKKAISTNTFQT